MKTFLNPEKISIEIQDCNGDMHILIAKSITCEDIDAIQKLTEKGQNKAGDLIMNQLKYIFGEQENFYKLFDIRVLKQVLEYFTQQMTNPTEAARKK